MNVTELWPLLERNPTAFLAAILVLALGKVWKLWRDAEAASDVAAAAISEQKLLNLRADLTLENRDTRIKDLERDRDRLERELDQCRGLPPRREVTP